jgi:bacterioferritin
MDPQTTIRVLNRALSIEYAGVIQYLQDAFLVQGPYPEVHENFFRKMSEEAWRHAGPLGKWVVLLNGIPTLEPAPIKQSTDLTEMLRQGLELEREAYKTYLEALAIAGDDPAPRFFIEEMVHDERLHIEEFERLLSQKTLTVTAKEVKLKPA